MLDVLYLVQKNVVHLIGDESGGNVVVECSIRRKRLEFQVFKVEGYNLVACDSMIAQVAAVDFE